MILPNYVSPTGHEPLFDPPLTLTDVSMCYLPLRATYNRMAEFVDTYLNDSLGGPQGCPYDIYFEPALPYVFVGIVDYGRIADIKDNKGGIAQNEVFFTIALKWWERVNSRRWKLKDWAFLSPFIYVDDVLSMASGREVYGWPKILCRFDRASGCWLRDPLGTDEKLTIFARGFNKLYSGESSMESPLVTLEQRPGPMSGRAPMTPADIYTPLQNWTQSAYDGIFHMRDIMTGLFGGMLSRVYGGGYPVNFWDPNNLIALASPEGAARGYNPESWMAAMFDEIIRMQALQQNLLGNMVNLKQFRSVSDPSIACYQAVTNAPMGLDRISGFGLLGLDHQLIGDSSGGFRMHIQSNHAPIVETLGILPESTRVDSNGVQIHTIKPLYPFWLECDMTYYNGGVIDDRTRGALYSRNNPDRHWQPPRVGQPDLEDNQYHDPDMPRVSMFDTSRGFAEAADGGKLVSPATTYRVLPLMAHQHKLQSFLDDYLNSLDLPKKMDFRAWGRFVYLIVASSDETMSLSNPLGTFEARGVEIIVPFKWMSDDGHLMSVGYVPAFAYTDSEHAAITASEVIGQPTTAANIQSPENTWLNDSGPDEAANRGLLDLRVEMLPALYAGQEAVEATLIRIDEDDVLDYNDDLNWRRLAADFVPLLEEHLHSMTSQGDHEHFETALALSLELLANERPFTPHTLKQFRDAHDVNKACYQALVRSKLTLTRELYDLREIEKRIHVSIAQYPTQPITETLGLIPKWTGYVDGRAVDYFQPIRPFWFRAATEFEGGKALFSRTHVTPKAGGWTPDKPVAQRHYFTQKRGDEGGSPIGVGPGLVEKLDTLGNAQNLRRTVQRWQADGGRSFGHQEAGEAVKAVEPQAVIEAILSRQWAHWGSPRNGLERKLDHVLRHDSVQEPYFSQFLQGELHKWPKGWLSPCPAPPGHEVQDTANLVSSNVSPREWYKICRTADSSSVETFIRDMDATAPPEMILQSIKSLGFNVPPAIFQHFKESYAKTVVERLSAQRSAHSTTRHSPQKKAETKPAQKKTSRQKSTRKRQAKKTTKRKSSKKKD